ncbi:hypothetical protein Pcinc_038501 [Petrolisthes cinctipes]|uniref:Uncharacterized protein n=1 Tax=Petrolisthes cinctipes TaxID=88211 RepID=A0AAE1EKD4_PETCI|nr:hypothetical protein Pcinc_038501 [Petrolisthes cinctipes]
MVKKVNQTSGPTTTTTTPPLPRATQKMEEKVRTVTKTENLKRELEKEAGKVGGQVTQPVVLQPPTTATNTPQTNMTIEEKTRTVTHTENLRREQAKGGVIKVVKKGTIQPTEEKEGTVFVTPKRGLEKRQGPEVTKSLPIPSQKSIKKMKKSKQPTEKLIVTPPSRPSKKKTEVKTRTITQTENLRRKKADGGVSGSTSKLPSSRPSKKEEKTRTIIQTENTRRKKAKGGVAGQIQNITPRPSKRKEENTRTIIQTENTKRKKAKGGRVTEETRSRPTSRPSKKKEDKLKTFLTTDKMKAKSPKMQPIPSTKKLKQKQEVIKPATKVPSAQLAKELKENTEEKDAHEGLEPAMKASSSELTKELMKNTEENGTQDGTSTSVPLSEVTKENEKDQDVPITHDVPEESLDSHLSTTFG